MRRAVRMYRHVVLVGCVLSIVAAGSVYLLERRSIAASQLDRAGQQLEDVQQHLLIALGELQASAAFIEEASPPIHRFDDFLSRLPISREQKIQWIWSRIIPTTRIAEFERVVRAETGDPTFTVEHQAGDTTVAPVVAARGGGTTSAGQDLLRKPAIRQALADVPPDGPVSKPILLSQGEQSIDAGHAYLGLIFRSPDQARPGHILFRGVAAASIRETGALEPGQVFRMTTRKGNDTVTILGDLSDSPGVAWLPARNIDFGDFNLGITVSRPTSSHFPWLWLPMLCAGLLSTFLFVSYRAAELNRREATSLGAILFGTREELDSSQQREATFFDNSGTANCETDYSTGKLTRVNDALCQMLGYSREELVGKTFAALTHPDDIAKSKQALKTPDGQPAMTLQFEKRYLRKDGSVLWGIVNARLLMDKDQQPLSYSTVITDITTRKHDEDTKSMLLRELAHRVRNTVQLTSSLARQTARTARSIKEYDTKFHQRLTALSSAQDLLFDTGWKSAPLPQIAARVIRPFLPDELDNVNFGIDLPAVELPTQQAQTLAIALHELTTNSASFGALAHGGTIQLSGTIEPEAEGQRPVLHLRWDESLNRRLRKPTKTGFGTIMLENALPDQFGGTARFEWHAKGIRYSARLPLP